MAKCEKDIMKGDEGKLRGELKATRDAAKDLECEAAGSCFGRS